MAQAPSYNGKYGLMQALIITWAMNLATYSIQHQHPFSGYGEGNALSWQVDSSSCSGVIPDYLGASRRVYVCTLYISIPVLELVVTHKALTSRCDRSKLE